MQVKVTCDRCGKKIKGTWTELGTSGYYKGLLWKCYMDEGEEIICDECMSADPRYRGDYGRQTA